MEDFNSGTENAITLKSLKAGEARFKAIVAASPDGIVVTDHNGFIRLISPAGLKIIGCDDQTLILERNIFDFIHPDDRGRAIYNIEKMFMDQFLGAEDYRLLCLDGRILDTEINGDFIRDENGEPDGFVFIVRDISGRKKAASELKLAIDKAENSNRLKTAFLNNISHEIRTPLNGILGYASLMVEPGLTEQDKNTYLQILDSSGERLIQTVTNYIDISLITSGNLEVHETMFLPWVTVEGLIGRYQVLCDQKKIGFSVDIEPEIRSLKVLSDNELLGKVLKHLLDNALKFTTEGNIFLKASIIADYIEFSIQDTGIGIRSEVMDIIFDTFMQEDATHARFSSGSGLGLPIVKGIADLLGGKIRVESVKGQGSTFYFSFPCPKS